MLSNLEGNFKAMQVIEEAIEKELGVDPSTLSDYTENGTFRRSSNQKSPAMQRLAELLARAK